MKDHRLSNIIKGISKKDLLEQAEDIDKPIKNGQSFTFSDESTSEIEHFLRYFCQDLDGIEDSRWEIEQNEDYGGWY